MGQIEIICHFIRSIRKTEHYRMILLPQIRNLNLIRPKLEYIIQNN